MLEIQYISIKYNICINEITLSKTPPNRKDLPEELPAEAIAQPDLADGRYPLCLHGCHFHFNGVLEVSRLSIDNKIDMIVVIRLS